jgi:branched-chain amino acid transport system permease protein
VFGTLIAVLFIQGFLIQWLPILIGGELRNLLFGLLILLAMNVRPRGLIDERVARMLRGLFVPARNA